jgi:hypothetical protein
MQGPQRVLPASIAAPVELVALPEVFSVVDKVNLPALQASSSGSTTPGQRACRHYLFPCCLNSTGPHTTACVLDGSLLLSAGPQARHLVPVHAWLHHAVRLLSQLIFTSANPCHTSVLYAASNQCCYKLVMIFAVPASRLLCSWLSCGRRLQCCSGSATRTRTSTGPPSTCRQCNR